MTSVDEESIVAFQKNSVILGFFPCCFPICTTNPSRFHLKLGLTYLSICLAIFILESAFGFFELLFSTRQLSAVVIWAIIVTYLLIAAFVVFLYYVVFNFYKKALIGSTQIKSAIIVTEQVEIPCSDLDPNVSPYNIFKQ